VLRPSTTEPGALTLIAEVIYRRVSGIVSADNRAYQYSGPSEGLISLDLNSLTSLGDRTTLTFLHSFDDSQIFGQGSTEFFVGASGLKVKLYGGAGNSQPAGPLAITGYFGFTKIFGAQVSYPLIRQREQALDLVGNFDALEGSITNAGVRSFDSLRIFRFSPDYVWSDIWLSNAMANSFGQDVGASWSAASFIKLQVSRGLTSLGASQNGSADATRPGEVINFTKGNVDISRTQTIYSWQSDTLTGQTRTISFRAEFAGQYTQDVLPPAEEFYLGGPHFDRGYYAGEVTGDSGMVATAELTYATPLGFQWRDWLDPRAEFYTFYDFGQTWDSRSTDAAHTLRSIGIGTHFFPTGTTQYEIDLEGVKRLQLFPQGPGVSPLKGEAVYWQATIRF
jgi:hemolysin activation/secretion protein